MVNTYINNHRPSMYAIKKHGTLKRLCKINSIIILQPDQGNNTIIMDRGVYVWKMSEVGKDHGNFEELSTDPTVTRDSQLQRFLRSMKDKQIFAKETYKDIQSNLFKWPPVYNDRLS